MWCGGKLNLVSNPFLTSQPWCKDSGDMKLHGPFLLRTHPATFSGISLRDQLVLGKCIIGKKRDRNSNRVLYMNMYEPSPRCKEAAAGLIEYSWPRV